MLADIITIGDEILIGQIVDTNSAFIASQLDRIGFRVRRILSVADERQEILQNLDDSIRAVDLVILTGGLGPTNDDITKKTLKEYFGGEYREDRLAITFIRKLCESRGLALTDRNRFQAMVPDSCETLQNSVGSAPGMLFRKNESIVVSLPGVSYEMEDILIRRLIPRLKKELSLPVRLQKTILTCEMAESHAADLLSRFENDLPEYAGLAYLPSPGILKLRISLAGDDERLLRKQLDIYSEEICRIMGPGHFYGYDGETLPSVLAKVLTERGASLAIAESCTGGTIAQLITSVRGSSEYFKGSVTAYSNEIKKNLLGVSGESLRHDGAVSRSVVEQMAVGIQKLMGVEFSIATSGIAGPGGGTDEKPVGTTWIAIALPGGVRSKKYHFGDKRDRNILRASVTALNQLRIVLAEYA